MGIKGYGGQEKNLGSLKANSFAALSHENLKQLTTNVSLKLGKNMSDADEIVEFLVENELKSFENFADGNPDILLPVDLDVVSDLATNALEAGAGQMDRVNQGDPSRDHSNEEVYGTPAGPLEGLETSTSWSEVIRRDKNRTKTKSGIDKITLDDRCFLEY
jgi:hypothetical protein